MAITDEERKRRQVFADYLRGELAARGWKPQHLADHAGSDASSIGLLLKLKRGVGPDLCRAIAGALGVPQAVVFLKAGLLTEAPALDSHALDPQVMTGLQKLEAMTETQRALAIEMMDSIQRRMKNEAGRAPLREGRGQKRAANQRRLALAK